MYKWLSFMYNGCLYVDIRHNIEYNRHIGGVKMTRISIRIDENLRAEADAILEELGFNMSSAINIFLKQLVRIGGLPFTPMLYTNRTIENKQLESLDSFLDFASNNKRIENSFKFNRDESHDR